MAFIFIYYLLKLFITFILTYSWYLLTRDEGHHKLGERSLST